MRNLLSRTALFANLTLLGLVAVPVNAFAAPAHTPGTSGHCYQWPTEMLTTGWDHGGIYATDTIMVTNGSPCLDINVHAVHNVWNEPMCATLRVRIGVTVTPWRRVCQGWHVLSYNATEGQPFTVESQGHVARVGVRA